MGMAGKGVRLGAWGWRRGHPWAAFGSDMAAIGGLGQHGTHTSATQSTFMYMWHAFSAPITLRHTQVAVRRRQPGTPDRAGLVEGRRWHAQGARSRGGFMCVHHIMPNNMVVSNWSCTVGPASSLMTTRFFLLAGTPAWCDCIDQMPRGITG